MRLLLEMRSSWLLPDVISYNSAISACEKGQQSEQALSLLLEMWTSHLALDVISYSPATPRRTSTPWLRSRGLASSPLPIGALHGSRNAPAFSRPRTPARRPAVRAGFAVVAADAELQQASHQWEHSGEVRFAPPRTAACSRASSPALRDWRRQRESAMPVNARPHDQDAARPISAERRHIRCDDQRLQGGPAVAASAWLLE